MPSSAATGGGQRGRLVDDQPAGRRQLVGESRARVAGDDRRRARRPRTAAAASAWRARSSRSLARVAVGRGSGRARSTASIAGRWPWRNVSRSRIADGSHDASSTFSTSSRAAGRSAPERDHEQSARVGERAGDRPRRRPRRASRRRAGAATPAPSSGRPDRCAADRRPRRRSATGSRPCGTSSWSSSIRLDDDARPAAPPGEPALAVISAVRAPAADAAASARFVAAVPPSCETPITSPPLGGSSASSNACADDDRARGRSASRPPGSPRAGSRPSPAPRARSCRSR